MDDLILLVFGQLGILQVPGLLFWLLLLCVVYLFIDQFRRLASFLLRGSTKRPNLIEPPQLPLSLDFPNSNPKTMTPMQTDFQTSNGEGSDDDYTNWSPQIWRSWAREEEKRGPQPENISLWTSQDRDRWKKHEWLRLMCETKSSSPKPGAPNKNMPPVLKTKVQRFVQTKKAKFPLSTTFSAERLGPACVVAKERLVAKLPAEIAERLVGHNRMRPHGTFKDVLQFNIWDLNQTRYKLDVLVPWFFCYNLVHLPPKHRYSDGFNTWYLQLYINTTRLYRNQAQIKEYLEKEFGKLRLKGFKRGDTPYFFRRDFTYTGALKDFPDFILPHYLELIGKVHPILMPVIDSFTVPLSDEERRRAIMSNKRVKPRPFNQGEIEMLRENSRFIPPSWRVTLLERSVGKCVHCKTPLTMKTARVDHIIPWSKGGATKLDNLQTLCADCNGTKGNRYHL